MDYFKRIDVIWEALTGLSGEQVLRYITGWHGTQLLDEGFYKYLVDEGVLPDDEGYTDDDGE